MAAEQMALQFGQIQQKNNMELVKNLTAGLGKKLNTGFSSVVGSVKTMTKTAAGNLEDKLEARKAEKVKTQRQIKWEERQDKFFGFMKSKWSSVAENKKVQATGSFLKKMLLTLLGGFALFALPPDFWTGLKNMIFDFGKWIASISWEKDIKPMLESIKNAVVAAKDFIQTIINKIFGKTDEEGNRQGGLLGKGGTLTNVMGFFGFSKEEGDEVGSTVSKFVAGLGVATTALALMFPAKAVTLAGKGIWGLAKGMGRGAKGIGSKGLSMLAGGQEGMAQRYMTPDQSKMSAARGANAAKAGPRVGKSAGGGGWFKKLMGKFGQAGKFLVQMGKSVIQGLITMGPYGWAILAGIALGGLVWYFWDDITKVWDKVAGTISEGFGKVKEMVVGAFGNVQGMVGGWLRGIGAGMIADWIDPKGADPEKPTEFTWGGFAGELWTIYKGIWSGIIGSIKKAAGKIGDWGIATLKFLNAPEWLINMLGGDKAEPANLPSAEDVGGDINQMTDEEKQALLEKTKKNAGKGGAGEVIQAPRSKKVRLEENERQMANTKASMSRVASRKGGATAGGVKEMNRLNEQLKGLQDVNKSIKSEQGDGEVSNNLSSSDKNKLKEALGKRESGGKYDVLNSLGFSGKYQFGDMALEDMGLLKPGASKLGSVAKVTGDPNNWNLKGGLSTWLSTGGLQESSMDKLMSNNLRVLKGAPGFKQFKRGDIAGALAAAHLVGAGGAKKFLAGNDSADAYGTKASDYFALGKNVIEAKEGFHGVVKKEIWFRTGEAGAERVDITPMRDPAANTSAMNSLQTENAQGKMGDGNAPTVVSAPQSTTVNNQSSTALIMPPTAKSSVPL